MYGTTSKDTALPQTGQGDRHESVMDSYEGHLRVRNLSDATVSSMCSNARIFLTYIESTGTTLSAITRADTAEYWVQSGQTHGHSSMKNVRVGLASFLRWLQREGILRDDLSLALPSVTGRTVRIKSRYTDEEVACILAAICRTDAIGRRDYAMLLIGAAFALRAKDVIGLKITDIDWVHSKITIVLHKTKRLHTVPMPPAVGNAILGYIIDGRPKSDSPCLFVSSRPPYQEFSSSAVCAAVMDKRIRQAGIDPAGRSCGFHVFRTHAASSLLYGGMPLSVISGYLGHANPDSIRPYISVDEGNMRSCCLPLDATGARGL